MTQGALAEAMGFSDHTPVSKVEQGKVSWTGEQIQKAASILNTTVSRLVGRDDMLPEEAQKLIDGYLGLEPSDQQYVRDLVARLARQKQSAEPQSH